MNPGASVQTEAVQHALAEVEKAFVVLNKARAALQAALEMCREEDRARQEAELEDYAGEA